MTVTDIVFRNKSKATIFLDGEIAFVLYKGDLPKYGIEVGSELAEPDYEEIMSEVLPKRAYERACKLLMSKDYTERKLREKLIGDVYPSEIIDRTIDGLKKERFLDDSRVAENYIYYKAGSRSKRRMFADLAVKGVSQDEAERIYNRLMEEGDIEEESAAVRKFLEKKHIDVKSLEFEEREKLFASLMRKGFSYDSVRVAVRGCSE